MSITVREILQRASRINGALANGDDLQAAEATNALTAYNNMTRGYHGTLIGVPLFPVSFTVASAACRSSPLASAPLIRDARCRISRTVMLIELLRLGPLGRWVKVKEG